MRKGNINIQKNELKIVCNLIANVDKHDKELTIKQIELKNLGFTDKEFNNHTYLNQLCNDLLSKPFKIPNTRMWVNWFSMLEPKEGIINYSFSEHLKPFLIDLKEQFTTYYLSNILKLTSSYSINIYELLKQLENIGFRKIEISEFRELLSIPKSYQFVHIKELLEKVSQDLEEHTDIKFNHTFIKTGRSFTHINFKILKNVEDKKIQDFIKEVRKNYVNQKIMTVKVFKKIQDISVNPTGKLYCLTNPDLSFDSKESQKLWDYFFENKDKLAPYTASLFN